MRELGPSSATFGTKRQHPIKPVFVGTDLARLKPSVPLSACRVRVTEKKSHQNNILVITCVAFWTFVGNNPTLYRHLPRARTAALEA